MSRTDDAGKSGYTRDFEPVLAAEWARILEQRKLRGVAPEAPRVGLALSGGGVRATAFGLGAAEGLARTGWFRRLDYLSGVGGGALALGALERLSREPAERDEAGNLLPPAARRHIAEGLATLTSGTVIRRTAPTASGGGKPDATFSAVALAVFQSLLSGSVYSSLLVGGFFLLAIGDSVVELLKPALRLVTHETAWQFAVTYLNSGLAAATVAVLVATVRVLWDPAARWLRRASRVIAPPVPAVGPRTWQGALWFLATTVCLLLALAAFFSITGNVAALVAVGIFGALTLRCARAWRSSWSEPQQVRATGAWGYVGVGLAFLSALIVAASLVGTFFYYILGSGPHVPAQPESLQPRIGLVVALVPVAWLGFSIVHLVRRAQARLQQMPAGAARAAYERSISLERKLGGSLAWLAVFLLLGAVQLTHRLAVQHVANQFLRIAGLFAAVVVGAVTIAGRAVGTDQERVGHSGNRRFGIAFARLSELRWRALCALVVFAIALLANATMWGILDGSAPHTIWLVVGGALLFGAASPLNFTGLSRVFRNRVVECVLPEKSAVTDETWRPALAGTEARLAEFGAACGPYPLINTSLTTTGSSNVRWRYRTADSFVLSPLYLGSAATGWVKTEKSHRAHLTVGDALATSALNLVPGGRSGDPDAGGRLLTGILALLSLRTGTWIPHPDPALSARRPRPNLLRPGIASDFTTRGLSESAPLICLSDGHHFDELGLYELLRRQLDVIFVADASQDPDLHHRALALCLVRASEDLGIEVTFAQDTLVAADVELEVAPGAKTPRARQRGDAAGALATIRYPGRERPGTLVLMKPVLRPSLPLVVDTYAAAHPSFPHEPQVVGAVEEERYYAYEELGLRVALDACEALEHAGDAASVPPRHSMITGPGSEEESATG